MFFPLRAAEQTEISKAEQDLQHRRHRRGQADAEQGGVRLAAHEEGDGDAHQEGASNALDHDERRPPQA